MIWIMVVLLMSLAFMVNMVLAFCGFILGNGYGIQVQSYVALLQGREMSALSHSRNLILSICCFRITALNVCQWPNG